MRTGLWISLALAPAAMWQTCVASELQIPAARYPDLPETASELRDFVPVGWYFEAKAEGDLNRDRVNDVVFVLREDNPANIVANLDGLGSNSLDTNPRILAVAFGTEGRANYRLALANHTLIPRHEDPVLDDPFASPGSLAVARGAFSVTLGFFASAGGWEMGQTKLTFRFQDDGFELIGLDRSRTHRGTGETEEVSINLSTGRASTIIGNIAEDEAQEAKWQSLRGARRYTIDQITDALRFDPREP
ncbi:hypothetical protein [Mesorhizobium sp. L-8-10]|uniref:hypothetical protein n=1 Tax=Mesorhizobium sp. L-8-10 TaxID=2744523 RepID=UPI001927A9C9|nr:hypothetical protein [Mesorhizobium sp. L-8-10]